MFPRSIQYSVPNLAANLPNKTERTRKGVVNFIGPTGLPHPVGSGQSDDRSWFMAVEYFFNGNIATYYLTNIHK